MREFAPSQKCRLVTPASNLKQTSHSSCHGPPLSAPWLTFVGSANHIGSDPSSDKVATLLPTKSPARQMGLSTGKNQDGINCRCSDLCSPQPSGLSIVGFEDINRKAPSHSVLALISRPGMVLSGVEVRKRRSRLQRHLPTRRIFGR